MQLLIISSLYWDKDIISVEGGRASFPTLNKRKWILQISTFIDLKTIDLLMNFRKDSDMRETM